MGKAENKKLAKAISTRIDEILNLTGLSIVALANLAGVGAKAIRSYHSGTLPISVETIDKVCQPFALSLTHFFDFETPIHISESELKIVEDYRRKYLNQRMGYFKDEEDLFFAKPNSTGTKREREYIAYIVFKTDYFEQERSIAQMLIDFRNEFDLHLESGRLHELLHKYLTRQLERKTIQGKKLDGSPSKRTIFLYYKPKKK
ncbi:helix-turn-helix domain-containing protein [Sphingobacterium deserti]|uniref:HTH cro/C1-type domain-containing protein n=1 Tax=Sphingobacterium deserti TaxID=1229276 RepID=A0A0B8T7C6_9SPHI|nr:helix-turn-helix transcriptional regulator [Sphingobacterium deserti]KGE14339.1 hypothetical protein DI53_1953 [Sphingobacterium deserti]